MQNRQGYCSYCCVRYNNLEQHMSSAQHRYLTTQNRQRMGTTSLMERFLQDVLRHHPYHSQESRSMQNERLLTNTASPTVSPTASPSEVVPVDDCISEEMTDDAAGVKGESSPKGFEPSKELHSRPSKSQEYIQGVSVRPSVIQKLEKGQQQPLEFVHKIGSGVKEFNPVGIGQATNNRQSLICPSVISSAPASCLPGSSYDRPVTTKTTRSPAAASLGPDRKCDPNKVDRYLEQPDRGSRNSVLSSNLETSSVSYQKPKESDRKSLCTNSDKLIIREDVKSQCKTLSTGAKVREFMGTEGSLKSESLSKLAVNQAINVNKTGMPSNKGLFEDAAAKHREKFFSGMDQIQEEKHLVFNKSAFLEQKSSVISETKFARGCLQSACNQPEEAAQDLWKEEQVDQEDKNYESRASEMSFDCSSFHSLTDQSKVTATEVNVSEEVYADLQCKNDKSYVSEVSSDGAGSLQLATNRTQVIVKGVSAQKAKPISLVDESYESSDSEINFDCDALLQSPDDYPRQPAKEGNLSKEEHLDLVDKNYGSSSSEISTDSALPLQSLGDQLPVAVTEAKLQKVHIGLVDKNYGSSCSETSTDNDVSLQSVVDHPQLVVKERSLKDRHVYLKDKSHTSSSAKEHLDYVVSLDTVTDESQRTVEEISLLEEKNEPVDMNYDSHGSEMSFHTDARLMAGQSGVIVKKVNLREVPVDLEDKSVKSSNSDQSFDSNASLYQSVSDQRQGALGEISLKELNFDMEVKSYGCSSSELTFESDPPARSGTEQSEMDIEEIRKRHINLEDHCGSNSSGITFDSDTASRSGGDQSQVAIYVEEPSPLENKTPKSCVSEVTFDSGIPVQSGMNQPGLAVKEVIVQKEDYIHLGRKNVEPSGSEISLDFYVPPHSVINSPEIALEKLNLQKEEQIYLESKVNEPSVSELSLDYIFHSITGHSKDPLQEVNLQKEEHIHLENKGNGPGISEISLKPDMSFHLVTDHPNIAEPDMSFHLVTDHPNIAVKETSHQKEHINLQDKESELSVYETGLDSGIHLHQSVTQKPEIAVKEIWLQKEKLVKFKSQSAKFSGSETGSDVPHYLVPEPQIAVEEISVQKEEHVLEKRDKYSSSGIMFDADVPPQSMTETPHIAVLKEDRVDPEGESTGSRGFAINLDIGAPLHSVIGQPQPTLLKERNVLLEDKNSESSHCKVRFDYGDPLRPLTGQFQEVVRRTTLWKEEDIGLQNKVFETSGSKLIHGSGVSLQPVADPPEVAVKRVNLENEGHVNVEDKHSQCSGSEMSLDSDFLVQSIVDQPQITILDQDHIELEEKHSRSGGSEISFDSEDPLQSVADQVRKTVKEISLWKDEVDVEDKRDEGDVEDKRDEGDVEDKRDESKGFEIVYDSDILFQSVAGQTEEVVKEINLWKEHVDLQGKIVEPIGSKINFDANEPLQSVANEIQEAITAEINLLREGHVCLDDKGYEPNDSEIIYVSDIPLQSVVEQPHILEGEHVNLEDKSNVSCPEITFISDDHLQSVADQLQKSVKEVSLWKEDRIYLEDKSYKLGDFEVSYDSDVPVHFVADQSPLTVKEINSQKRGHTDLESKSCGPSVSEIKCDSGVHFQLEVDQSQVVCKEIDLPKERHLGMEVKSSEPSDSEMMCDSDVPLEIVVNELQVSVKEANLRKMLFVDLVTSDSDCEVIAESDIPFQPVIDSPHMTVKEIDCINTEDFDLGECCDSCDSEVGYVCEASPPSMTNEPKETFKVVNQKKDYIILQESSCEAYGSEIKFQIDPPDRSVTYPLQGSDKEMVTFVDSEAKSCRPHSPKTHFKWEDNSEPVTSKLQKADKGSNFCHRKDENTGRKDKHCESRGSAATRKASPGSAGRQRAGKGNPKLKHADRESRSCEPCGSGMSFQCDRSLQSDSGQLQQAVSKKEGFKKRSVDLKGKKGDSRSGPVLRVASVRNREKAKEVIEDNPDEPVLEALPHVPPSFVGKTWSQIMREDDMKINALVKEFKEGRFHCYFDDDCETRKVKKKNLNKGKKITWADVSQDTAAIQVFSDGDDNAGGISDTDDFSVALDKPSHHPTAKRPYEQSWRVASRCQAVKVSHGTQTNLTKESATKASGPEEDSPTRKRLLLQKDRKMRNRVQIGTLEFPETCTKVLKPLQPNALVYVISSNMKFQNGESFNFAKKYLGGRSSRDVSIQYKYKRRSFDYYDPLNKKIVTNPPESDRNNWLQIHLSDLSSSSDEDGPAEGFDPTGILTLRDELMAYPGARISPERVPRPGTSSASQVPSGSNFQSTPVGGDAARTSPKSATRKILEGKKKIQRRKMKTSKPGFPQKVYKPIILHQKPRIASEKPSIWIRTKLSDIIRKYISKYSAFLRRKYQSRSAFIRLHLKKKCDVTKSKKAKKPAKMPLGSPAPSGPPGPPVPSGPPGPSVPPVPSGLPVPSVPSGPPVPSVAAAEGQLGAVPSCSPKPPVQNSWPAAGRKRNGTKKRPRKRRRKPFRPVKIYALRSLYSQVPYSDRMRTRLSDKSPANEAT
ncbi:DBF4-type zinc finger-containing protein 2 isoform X1 [Herpailurus yagouaroundi]|uniref:DBF4-type zinc finger-containing protein 2 isoform X1 n=1 Tax=Herpailurus yagouaroundi TaxID=1608482 RepID=UPI001AD71C7C|nr:DBF4-type zinc finger-containing protein 2 isoform X1 [Puma yagouaroundi]XP_040331933.1 DBF4-type zinc finger-containing protein 2 isoform X1 [Puma yagouaroundi]XP_040331934.1 DBF4-type zinc finger-containing protein 2 isoform X1 [Puma yagouaroundi]